MFNKIATHPSFILMAVINIALLSNFIYAANVTTALSSSLCTVITSIRGAIGVVALTLFVLGATLYAVANFLPAAGNFRTGLQGWAMGMMIGGVVGIILILIGPFILDTVVSVAANSIAPIPTC